MKINSKGQVTIPAPLREKHGLSEGDDVDVVEDGDTLRIVWGGTGSPGERLVTKMRGRATTTLTTDELMTLLRAD